MLPDDVKSSLAGCVSSEDQIHCGFYSWLRACEQWDALELLHILSVIPNPCSVEEGYETVAISVTNITTPFPQIIY